MDKKRKIMIVDDDPNIVELIDIYLKKEGYETDKHLSGVTALDRFDAVEPDLILLDIMLPEIDGYDVCTEVRKKSDVPIIMITAKGETFDKVLGLELGADDYLVKPFEAAELLARVKAVLRRYGNEMPQKKVLEIENLKIDLNEYSLTYHGKKLEMPKKELEVLHFLIANPNHVFTREKLLDKIWGYEYVGESRTVDVHIKRIREKLSQEDPWEIKTVWSVGYKFQNKE